MRLWRICHPKVASDPLSGEGARRYGGRWNRKGQRAVYTATSSSLCLLEVLAQTDPVNAPGTLVLIACDLPDQLPVMELEVGDLPSGWQAYPAPADARALGERWLDAGETVALKVPSAIMPHGDDRNVVLNVEHPDFALLVEAVRETIELDPRLLESG